MNLALKEIEKMLKENKNEVIALKNSDSINKVMVSNMINDIKFVKIFKTFNEQSEYESLFANIPKYKMATRKINTKIQKLVTSLFGQIEFKNDGPILKEEGFVDPHEDRRPSSKDNSEVEAQTVISDMIELLCT